MKITYTLTNEDKQKYIDTNFDSRKKTIPVLLILVGSIILLIIAILALISKEYLMAAIISAFLLIMYVIVKLPKQLKQRYIASISVDEERTVIVNDTDLTIIKSSRITTYKYTDVSTIDLINDYFIFLRFKPGDSIFIPRSAFSSKDEMIDLINIIKTNARIL